MKGIKRIEETEKAKKWINKIEWERRQVGTTRTLHRKKARPWGHLPPCLGGGELRTVCIFGTWKCLPVTRNKCEDSVVHTEVSGAISKLILSAFVTFWQYCTVLSYEHYHIGLPYSIPFYICIICIFIYTHTYTYTYTYRDTRSVKKNNFLYYVRMILQTNIVQGVGDKEGSLACRTVAESLPYLVQFTCCTSLLKHVFVTFSDTSEYRL
jgi:hypothetical protein